MGRTGNGPALFEEDQPRFEMTNKLHELEFRTYRVGADLRQQIKARRETLGQTMQGFIGYALETELDPLVKVLAEELPNLDSPDARPVRLPFTPGLLSRLQEASTQTGLPANRLLLVCLLRAAGRKRRRNNSSNPSTADQARKEGS
jgi:hypothetical protein